MTNKRGPYRQYIQDLQLSIERETQDVPADGKYYVLFQGEVLGAFRALKDAQSLFKQKVKEQGYAPATALPNKSISEMQNERYMEAKDLYWANSHKYRGGGGRGGRGGV